VKKLRPGVGVSRNFFTKGPQCAPLTSVCHTVPVRTALIIERRIG
jgi:hypothetical protein